jgi:hypothetical protein
MLTSLVEKLLFILFSSAVKELSFSSQKIYLSKGSLADRANKGDPLSHFPESLMTAHP